MTPPTPPPTPEEARRIARWLRFNWGYGKTARTLEEWAGEREETLKLKKKK